MLEVLQSVIGSWGHLLPFWALHIGSLTAAVWITYVDVLQGQWVSDDFEGVANLDGKFKRIGHPQPAAAGGVQSTTAPPAGGSLWNDVLSWVRWHIGKAPNPNYQKPRDPNKPDGPKDDRQFIPHAARHHRLNLFLFNGIVIMAYSFLCTVVGPEVAFLATLLWVVHPVGAQCVAWISGIGYLIAAFFMLVGLNGAVLLGHSSLYHNPVATLFIAGTYFVVQFLAFRGQFTSIAVVVILAYLKLWPLALVAAMVAGLGLLHTFLTVISVRSATFKQQQMGASTQLHPRKIVVVMKTLYYYTKLAFFPKRLGLYHTAGYHYPMPWIEWEDKHFWSGVVIATVMGLAAWLLPPPTAFGLLWWTCFIVFVLNWITVHQFIAERYIWLPSLGLCLIVASFAPSWLYWAVVGILLMRTWAHLPTYYNELMFYQSNVWNHPTSEVAYGNLGVTYLRMNLPGAAVDHWNLGANRNQDYDVNWYNLYSIFRSQHLLEQARTFLLKALSCTTCHFPKEWRTELETLELEIQWQKALAPIPLEQKDTWQKVQLEQLLKRPDLPHRPWWEEKYRQLQEYLKKKPIAPPPPTAMPREAVLGALTPPPRNYS